MDDALAISEPKRYPLCVFNSWQLPQSAVPEVWSYSWAAFQGVSDLPSNESYFSHINRGWTGPQDMLTMILNAASLEIAGGRPHSERAGIYSKTPAFKTLYRCNQ